MNAQKLILIVFSYFILTDGYSTVFSEFYPDYSEEPSMIYNNVLDLNINSIYNFREINDILHKISRGDENEVFSVSIHREISKVESKWNNVLTSEEANKNANIDSLQLIVGKVIQIIAEPEVGYLFNHWTLNGKFLSSAIKYEFKMPSNNASIVGHFDKIEPASINITSPAISSSFSERDRIALEADVKSEKATITAVEFFVDGKLLASFNKAPYKFLWENASLGEHDIVVKAKDNSGLSSMSSRKFYVIDQANVAPKVRITGPTTNAQFIQGGNVSITADATDPDGKIAKVEFYNGNTLLGTDTTSPYSFAWTDIPSGNINLTAKATDNKGTVTVSDAVKINVAEKEEVVSRPGSDLEAAGGLLEGLVSFYEMNTNNSGVLKDSHGKNHGISTKISHGTGFNEKGNKYDGKSSISSVPHSASLNLTTEFTLMADIFREDNGQGGASIIIGKTYSTSWPENQAYSLAITKDNKIRVRTNISGVKDWVSSQTVPVGKWVRIIATYKSGEGYSLYLDTTNPEKSGKISGTIAKSSLELTIGSATMHKNAANQRRFEGVLDNVGMWNRKLSQDEISELITTKITYPDFGKTQEQPTYKVALKTMPESSGTLSTDAGLNDVNAGQKVKFVSNAKKGFVFDYWSVDGLKVSDHSAYEFEMPAKDIVITGHFRDFKTSEIKIISPVQNSQFIELSDIKIEIASENNDGKIKKVEIFHGATLIATLNEGKNFIWKGVGAGQYVLKAKAYDENGSLVESAAVNIKVVEKANTAPKVNVTGPTTNAQFIQGGNVSITANASDSDGKIAKVEFYNGNTLLGTDTTSPYSFAWTNLPKGDLTLTAKATDNKGTVTVSDAVKIKVVEKANVAPKVRITGPTANAQFIQGGNVSITANASDSDGKIAKVEFYNGNTLLGTDTTSPYSFTWTNLPVGSLILTAKATDNKGTVTVSDAVKINVAEEEKVVSRPGSQPESTGRLLEGLVSFYEMNTNNSGVLKDSHGKNHGISTKISHGKGFNEKGNSYDGKSSISSVPHSASLNLTTEFTLMADIFRKGNGQNGASIIIGKTYSTSWPENQAYSLAITKDNKIRVRTNISGLKDWVSSQTVPVGKWVRVIATYKSGEGYSLYFDTTKPEKSGKISGTIAKSELELTIGSATWHKNAANQRRFEGVLDNVGMWSRKLSQDEISELITRKITYPDFGGNQFYRISMSSITSREEATSTSGTTTKAEAGEKLIFIVEDEEKEGFVFDHWSLDGVQISNQTLFELDMPEKDINLIKHFRKFIAPEISIAIPDQMSEVEAFSDVLIKFITKSNDAEIEKIELLNGDNIVGQLTPDLSEIDWKNIPAGNHQLVGRITDTNGKTYFSDPLVLSAVDNQSKDIPNVLLEYTIGPNPTNDYLNVIFANLDGVYDFEIRIVSMNGSVEKSINARPEESTVRLDVSDLKNGVYVLHLIGNGHNLSSKKFIKL